MKENRRQKRIVQHPVAKSVTIENPIVPSKNGNFIRSREYSRFLRSIKDRIKTAQQRAVIGANRELVHLYWDIGRMILRNQRKKGWGSKVVETLSRDLCLEFPDIKGFSVRNLKYMRSFAKEYDRSSIVQQLAAQLPWFHICVLLEKVHDKGERHWYIQQCIAHGWSRNVLVHQIEAGLYRRRGKAVTNFDRSLPGRDSDLARQTVKDPYIFDFLGIGPEARERDLERALLDNIRDFLLELGLGFSFVGSQYRIEVGGEDFYIDLLFYHLRLRRFMVVDLKAGGFQPEHAGKMSFYLSAVDRTLRHPTDGPSIGLILCKSRNDLVAEYTMSDMRRPMGVATYRMPKKVMAELPAPELFKKKFRRRRDHDRQQ